jgi:hypothetical protein
MSPRQVAAYYSFAVRNMNREFGIELNLHAMASQGAGKEIREAVDKLMRDS